MSLEIKQQKQGFEDIDLSSSPDKNPDISISRKGYAVIESHLKKNLDNKIGSQEIDDAVTKYITQEVKKCGPSGNLGKVERLGVQIEQEIKGEPDLRKKLEKISLLAKELDISSSTNKGEQFQSSKQFQDQQAQANDLQNKDLRNRVDEFKKLIAESEELIQRDARIDRLQVYGLGNNELATSRNAAMENMNSRTTKEALWPPP